MFVVICFLSLFALGQTQCPPLPKRDTADVRKNIYDGSYNFGVNFFKTIANQADKKHNVFVSPFSVYNALLLAYFGAGGNTKKQLEQVLNLGRYSKQEFTKALLFDEDLNSKRNDSKYILEVANRVYLDGSLRVNPCLLLGDKLELANFTKSQELVDQINKWVKTKTRGRITDLVRPEHINPSSAFALINAAYFKGKWQNQFKVQHTKTELFYPNEFPQDLILTDMMYQKGTFRYGASEELQAYLLELPYIGSKVSMYILLPPYVQGGLNEILNRLTPEALQSAIGQMYPTTLQVFIPKFKMERNYELQVPLYSMGLSDLFDPTRANFTEFVKISGLSIGAALHKSFIKVDEEGSEAAAATALIGFRSARPIEPEKFAANHPFIYIIYDNYANTILFMGILRNPNL